MEKELLEKEFDLYFNDFDISTLIAIKDNIQKIINQKRKEDFKNRVQKIRSMVQELIKDYPSASANLETSIDEEDVEFDILDHFNKLHWDF